MFLSISLVKTPPNVSIPNDRGVTSNNKTSLTSPAKTAPCIAAPNATHSSGFTPLFGSLPKNSLTVSTIFGIRVMPPTKTTSSISLAVTPASFNAALQGSIVLFIKSSTKLSSFALVNLRVKCLGPEASAVIKGKFTSVCAVEESSILAFSAASFNLCNANLSDFKSIPLSFLNSSIKY